MMKHVRLGVLTGLIALGLSCSRAPLDAGNESADLGSIGLEIQVAGLPLTSVGYTITGPAGFARSGSIPMGAAGTVSAVLSGFPVGTGYQLNLSGASADGRATCTGSATFSVDGPATKRVDIHLQCTIQGGTGSIAVAGTLNVCPRIETLDAVPATAMVGETITLTATASDADGGPSPLAYAWTATRGLVTATAAGATFKCTNVGTSQVALSVSDGDTCPALRTVDLTCTPAPELSTDPGLKVAFIGDTNTGPGFRGVLSMIKAEGAQALVVEGDMSYTDRPDIWWGDVEDILGLEFPVFISRGNHDDFVWDGFQPKAAAHLGGATRTAGAHDSNYKTVWRGLVIATIRKGDTGANIAPFLANDPHMWRVCQWHQNQAAMTVGLKADEMGWDVYETCRMLGALVTTGHDHLYSRTKTLISTTDQIVDPTCPTPGELCIGPGRIFVSVVGVGGYSWGRQERCLPATPPYGCKGEWASIFTTSQHPAVPVAGAQFITFNDGDPKKATGYFRAVTGELVDTFTITNDGLNGR